MKKLMIAVCAIALAAVSQAATLNWSLGTVYGIGEGGNGYTGEGFNGTADIQLIIGSSLSGGAIGDIVYDAVTSAVTFEYGYAFPAAVSADLTTDGLYYTQVILTSGDSTLKSGIYELNNAKMYSGDLYPAWGGEGESALIADAASGATLEGVDSFVPTYGAFSAGGWQSVPEPTSGLLLLIGVAGLALRRRRA